MSLKGARPPLGEDAALLACLTVLFSDGSPARIGVAVSGGGDSMALLHLCLKAASGMGWTVHAVTVDHGLRPESAAEADTVAAYCRSRGISHATLRWTGGAPVGNLMDQARRARTALIAQWASQNAISTVLLGHTADDQAESFLMNLARASGVDGLSGLRPQWHDAGIHWHRPLLAQPREALRAYLRGNDVTWVEDPSNENDRFTRVKARRALKALSPLGITVHTLNATIGNLALARQSQQALLQETVDGQVREIAGGLAIELAALRALNPDLRRRLLIAMIRWMSGRQYAPRQAQLAQLAQALDLGRDATLAGCRFRQRKDQVFIAREARAVAGVSSPLGQLWDNRWRITGPQDPALRLRALGAEGLLACPNWRDTGFSRDQLLVCPAIWQEDRLIAAPLAGNPGQYRAEIDLSFNRFVLSH